MRNCIDEKTLKKLKDLSEQAKKAGFFTLVDESKFPKMVKMAEWGIIYLESQKYKTQIEANTNLLVARIAEIEAENSSAFTCSPQ